MKKAFLAFFACMAVVLIYSTPVCAAYTSEFNPQPYNTKEEVLAEMVNNYTPIFDELSNSLEVYKEGRELLADEKFREEFLNICYEYDEQPEIVLAVIFSESRFDPKAQNGKCVGMMQVNEECHADRMKRTGVSDLSDPLQNIRVGVDYLAELQSDGNGLEHALMVYNGDSKAKESLRTGKYSDYANSIAKYAEDIRKKLQENNTNK